MALNHNSGTKSTTETSVKSGVEGDNTVQQIFSDSSYFNGYDSQTKDIAIQITDLLKGMGLQDAIKLLSKIRLSITGKR